MALRGVVFVGELNYVEGALDIHWTFKCVDAESSAATGGTIAPSASDSASTINTALLTAARDAAELDLSLVFGMGDEIKLLNPITEQLG